MLHIILYQPQIPQNTGNIGRMCAITESRLHLIHPLGFEITDKQLKRSGMDYWYSLDVHHHESWEEFIASDKKPDRIWMFTTHAKKSHWDAQFSDGDGLLFGNEGAGCPRFIHEQTEDDYKLKIPHMRAELRSLNLATSAGIATYEVLRQIQHV
jgi:tRNA (cytidine/uridine-2'-O-)-methyltransferase